MIMLKIIKTTFFKDENYKYIQTVLATKNPGPGGWGAVIIIRQGKKTNYLVESDQPLIIVWNLTAAIKGYRILHYY